MTINIFKVQIILGFWFISISDPHKGWVFEINSWSGIWYSPNTSEQVMYKIFPRRK